MHTMTRMALADFPCVFRVNIHRRLDGVGDWRDVKTAGANRDVGFAPNTSIR